MECSKTNLLKNKTGYLFQFKTSLLKVGNKIFEDMFRSNNFEVKSLVKNHFRFKA